jgi:type VI secretion system secreted protein VgrG
MNSLATLHAKALGDVKLMGFRGHERIGRPYRFDLYFTAPTALALGSAVGTRATLRMARDLAAPFPFHGILASAELLVQTPQWALHHAVLVPKVWQLSLTKHSRAYTKLTLPQLLKKVLEASGLTGADYELRLGAGYAQEELIVQYRENELDFLHRWMEHEGVSYFFEQGDDQEKLVVVDSSAGFEKLSEKRLRYHPILGSDRSHGEIVDAFTVCHNSTVGSVHVADYDYSRPMLEIAAKHPVSPHGFGVHVEHTGRFFDPAHAERYATIRAQELKAREVLYHLGGNALHVSAGHITQIDEHPSEHLNQKKYLVIEASHFCNQLADAEASTLGKWVKPEYPEVYRVEASAVDAAHEYRLPRSTVWPRVWGYENGVVDGPHDSPYAQIDEQGRYLVKFQFDESGLGQGKASTWVRMMQPHGGTTEGFHFPLRKGTEVMFTFLGGDPDRPVITGVVPNALTPSKVIDANYTQNVIQTGAENYIKLEDMAGSEFIHVSTPNHGTQLYMGSPWGGSGRGGGASWMVTTAGNGAILIGGNEAIEVLGNVGEWVSGNYDLTVSGAWSEAITGTQTSNVTGHVGQSYSAGQSVAITGTRETGISADDNVEVGGGWNVNAHAQATLQTATWQSQVSGLTKLTTGSLDYQSGPTKLTFGPTNFTWAATTGHIDHLDLEIPGGATVMCPKWELLDSHHHVVTAQEEHGIGTLKYAIGTLLDVKGFSCSVTGIDISLKGVSIGNKGIKLESGGLEAKQKGLKAYVQGLHFNLAGIHMLS